MQYYQINPTMYGPLTLLGKSHYWGEEHRVVQDDIWGIIRHVGTSDLAVSGDKLAVAKGVSYYERGRDYYVLDGCGDIVDPKVVIAAAEVYEANRPLSEWEWKAKQKEKATRNKFRCGPVPGTGKGRFGFGSWYRYIKTTQEIRENDSLFYDEDAIEQDVKPRARRGRHSLPTAWDDRCRSDCKAHSWKRHRKYQWK